MTIENLTQYDIILLSTDHTNYDYNFIVEQLKLIIDTRYAFIRAGVKSNKVFKA